MLTQTPLGRVLLRIAALSQAIAFFLVLLLHRSPRDKHLYLTPIQRPNLEHLRLAL
jgi:hypothetical protein